MGRAPAPAAKPQQDEARRRFVVLPLAQLVPSVTRAAFGKRSPAGATLMAEWVNVVGPRLAAVTEPRRLRSGQLTIACTGPVAMELSHLQATLIETINTYAGHPLVDRLRFTQDHVQARSTPPPPRARAIALEAVQGVAEGPLQEALSGLLHALRSRS